MDLLIPLSLFAVGLILPILVFSRINLRPIERRTKTDARLASRSASL
jgi:hypothetical protein